MRYLRNALCAAALVAALTPAHAECADEIKNFVDRRDALMNEIGPIPSPGEETRLTAAACPKLQKLVATLDETVGWFQKNKQQCGVVDAVIDSIASQRARIADATADLCKAAPKKSNAKKPAAR